MKGSTHLRTVTPATTRELLGPAEGQYVTQGLLGTNPDQQQNTGRDAYTIVVPVTDGDAAAMEGVVGPQLCFEISWTPGTGKAVTVRLNKTDCSNGVGTGGDTGTLDACIAAIPGTYILNIFNPYPDDEEVSFPYTLTITGPEGTTVELTENEAPESPQICD
jgi:hypothetical protein